MMRLIIVALLLCVTRTAVAGVVHLDTPGQTLYARVFTGATASFAVALTEGTGNGVGRYAAADGAILSAAGGTLAAGDYAFKVFIGTASTSANDTMLASGVLPWGGTAELPPGANTKLIESTDATDALDARFTAYGALKPTVAGRTLDVDADGTAGIDWANISDQDAIVTFLNTAVNDVQQIGGDDPDTVITAGAAAALQAIHLDHLLAVAYDAASEPGAATALLNVLVQNDAGTPQFTTNSLERGPSGDGGSGGFSGGGVSFTIYVGTLDPNPTVYDVIQGEQRTFTIAVQANPAFASATPDAITATFRDKDDNLVTIENEDITRVTEDANFQVVRFTLPAEESETLSPGFVTIQLSFDNEKVQTADRIRIVESL